MTIQKALFINEKQTLSGIKDEFNRCYEFLRLEFYTEPREKGKSTVRNKMVTGNMMISFLQSNQNSGVVYIPEDKTVAQLESEFLLDFGLNMQVFRKSGNIWLETSSTHDWTLKQQNDEGKNLAVHLKIVKENPEGSDVY